MSTYRSSIARIFALLLVLPILLRAGSVAAEDAVMPGFTDLGAGAGVTWLVTGSLESGDLAIVRLVVERLTLAPNATLPDIGDPQLIAVESGNLTMSDDLGLSAGLAEGEQLFAEPGAFPEISADQPTTLLRARLTDPAPDLVIDDAACTLASPSFFNLDGLTISNTSAADQPFTIGDIGLNAVIPAGEMAIVSIARAPEGSFEAHCGQADDRTTLSTLSLEVHDGHQPHGDATLFDNEIALVPADGSTFYMANIALAADGSLGKQTFSGPTVIAAANQPFWVKRPRRLTSTISRSESALLPPGTQATIENAGKDATSALVIGIVPSEAESAKTSAEPTATTSSDAPDSRPVTRDEQGSAFDAAALEAGIPSVSAAANAGFDQQSVMAVTDSSNSVICVPLSQEVITHWQGGASVVYAPVGNARFNNAFLDFGQFDSDAAAADARTETVALFDTFDVPATGVPPSDHFASEDITMRELPESAALGAQSMLTAIHGNMIIQLAVFASSQEDATDQLLALWAVVDQHLDDQGA